MITIKRFIYNLFLNLYFKEVQIDNINPIIARRLDVVARVRTALLIQLLGFKISYIVFGDSNSENLKSSENSRMFDEALGFGINIGIGGSTPGDWIEFLNSSNGKLVYDFIFQRKYQILNVGGNCILRNKMTEAESTLQVLHQLFPYSVNCLVPPLNYSNLEPVHPSIKTDVEELNKLILKVWGEAVVDTHTPFVDYHKDDKGEPYFWVHQDAVHFSEIADNKVRIPLIIAKIKSLK